MPAAKCCMAVVADNPFLELSLKDLSASILRFIICSCTPYFCTTANDCNSFVSPRLADDESRDAIRTRASPNLAGSMPKVGSALAATFSTVFASQKMRPDLRQDLCLQCAIIWFGPRNGDEVLTGDQGWRRIFFKAGSTSPISSCDWAMALSASLYTSSPL